jgi:hypothetical protein
MQLCGARPDDNFDILKLISSKYVKAFKSYKRNSVTKQAFLSVDTGFFLITIERVYGFCPSSNSTCHIA